jgi:beta-lactamase class A
MSPHVAVRRAAELLALTALVAFVLGTAATGSAGASGRPLARRASADPFASPALRRYLAGRAGNVTAAVYDVETGRTYLYRPGVREQTASIIKVDILATLLREQQARGGLSGAEEATAQGMIEASDNDDATDLWDAAGGASAVHAFDEKAGMSQTTPNPAWGLTTTTPLDQLTLLRLVMLPNHLLSTASRIYEYELMRNVIPSEDWGVSGGVGAGAAVALKNGWLPLPGGWQVNSIGQIAGSGRRYLLAVMTSGDPTEDYGIATIEGISASVWAHVPYPSTHGR